MQNGVTVRVAGARLGGDARVAPTWSADVRPHLVRGRSSGEATSGTPGSAVALAEHQVVLVHIPGHISRSVKPTVTAAHSRWTRTSRRATGTRANPIRPPHRGWGISQSDVSGGNRVSSAAAITGTGMRNAGARLTEQTGIPETSGAEPPAALPGAREQQSPKSALWYRCERVECIQGAKGLTVTLGVTIVVSPSPPQWV